MTDDDPRIVELYDVDNPDGPDHDFYRSLADVISAGRILDLVVRNVDLDGRGRGKPDSPGGRQRFSAWIERRADPIEGTSYDHEPGVVFVWTERGELAHATRRLSRWSGLLGRARHATTGLP